MKRVTEIFIIQGGFEFAHVIQLLMRWTERQKGGKTIAIEREGRKNIRKAEKKL